MIYTFYSYKGGVGRSMALANVAEFFYRAGLKVLMVDWDLEAPGLERFFSTPLERTLEHPGVMDMLLDYKTKMSREPSTQENVDVLPFKNIESYVLDIYPPEESGQGQLWLLPAGRRATKSFSEYANAVISFNWKDFYENWEGELFFEWLRQQFEERADVVLLDSRTGVTEMGGVCTYQLADAVVMFCTGSQQSIDGTHKIARKLKNPEVKNKRAGRDLDLLIVPARIEKAESELLDKFQAAFAEAFDEFVPSEEGVDIQQLWEMGIPYVPKYAFTEEVAIRETGKASAEDMSKSFREIGLAMLRLGSYELFQQVVSQVSAKTDKGFRKLRVFVASAADTANERAKIEMVVSIIKPLADHLGIALEVFDWRAALPEMGRPDEVIVSQLKLTSWDIFIGVLWHRFGTPPTGRDLQTQKEYVSGTEEEFMTAYRLLEQYDTPRIMMYRCKRDVPLKEFDPEQFVRVKEFFAKFEASEGGRPGFYHTYDSPEAFEKLLFDNLQRLLLDYGEQISGKPAPSELIQAFSPRIVDNLPRRAPFFGRDKELDIVMRALSPEDRTWGVLVDGIGGIGKSALAVEAGHRCKDKNMFDAFIFVSAKENILDPKGIRQLKPAAHTLDEFLNETARVLGQAGVTKLAGDDKRRALLDALRGTRSLLIYDNLETLAKAEQEALADFLRELPTQCKAILTSRRRGGEGAVWLRLAKLEWEAAHSIIENEMARDPQLANKLRRAGEARWQELYDETKGSPLALVHTLALMRVRAALTFDGVLDSLRGNRNQDLQRFIFQDVRRELTANDETALRALSFFAPSATFEAWTQVSGLSRNALETTIDRLSALSLVDILAGEERYALHPLTRNFVREELLSDARIARETGMSFANYWLVYAQQYGDSNKESYKTYDRLEAEWSNLDVAAEWLWQTAAIQGEEIGDVIAARMLNDLARALSRFLLFSARWDERVQLSARVYEGIRKLNLSQAGWRAFDAAWTYCLRGDNGESKYWADHSAKAWAIGGSKYEQAVGKQLHGLLAKKRGDYDAAEKSYQDALAIYRELEFEKVIAIVLNDLGGLESARARYDKAESYFRESLDIYQRRNDTDMIPSALSNLGRLKIQRGQWENAGEWFEKALTLSREVGRQDLVASNLYGLARVYEQEGQNNLSLSMAREALAIYERLQHINLEETQELIERLTKKAGGEG